MQYTILTQQDYIQINLPEISTTDLVRGNITNRTAGESDIVVDTISALALFLTEAAKHGKEIADVAKDGIKGIKEWAEILKMVPQIIPVLVLFYHSVIKNAEEFYTAVQNITPEQKSKSVVAFMQNFDLTNDKAEQAIERSISMILEIISLIKSFK